MAVVVAARLRTEILISGFGGQGVIRMGQILGLCAIKQGHRVTMLKSHGTETRGGYVRAQLVIAPEYVDSPVVENADVFVAFSAPAYKKFFDCCRGHVLYDPEMVTEVRAEAPERHVAVPATALANDGFSFVHVRFPCNENFGAYALGTRDTLKNLEWIYEHTQGRKADGTETDFTWETGIKHDASNSRPEFSKILRDMNARVRAEAEAKAASRDGGHAKP